MYECIYGYTPFACDDRHQTKMKILKHKSTFGFPAQKAADRPSYESMDVIMHLLVEKEKRLCSRKYRLNDYTTQLIAGRPVKFAADKYHKNYEGYFVYPDDAGDLKRHPFFNGIPWDTMLQRRPPFRPQVDHWEDTRYFEEETPVSDIAEGSSDATRPGSFEVKGNNVLASPLGSKNSQHHQEAQHIIPSVAIKPSGTIPTTPELAPDGTPSPLTGQDGPSQQPTVMPLKKHKKKDKKRARDKILRDPELGKTALELRRKGAFMGYAYSKPKRVEDVVDEVLDAHSAEWHKHRESTVPASLAERVPV